MGNKEVGSMGEKIACDYLTHKGFEIIERNVRFSRYCEIDIIAKKKDTLVFVEVKTRKTDFLGSPFEAITKKKYEHIKTGVFTYLQDNNYKKFRIDAVAVTLYPELKVEHLENIWL